MTDAMSDEVLARLRATGAALALLLALALAACAPTPETSLAELVADAETYDGHEVVVTGVVVAFGEEDGASRDHVVLEDAESNRVLLEPAEAVAPHEGASVEVRGEFSFSPERGRRIRVADVVAR